LKAESSSFQKLSNLKKMKEFMLVYRNAASGDIKPTPEQVQAVEKQWSDWFESIAAQGKLESCNRPGSEGKTLKSGNVVTDGPYAEIKEILLGVSIVRAESIDDAVEIAKGCPVLRVGGNVEVRDVTMMNQYN
jgi:hypothetical protein